MVHFPGRRGPFPGKVWLIFQEEVNHCSRSNSSFSQNQMNRSSRLVAFISPDAFPSSFSRRSGCRYSTFRYHRIISRNQMNNSSRLNDASSQGSNESLAQISSLRVFREGTDHFPGKAWLTFREGMHYFSVFNVFLPPVAINHFQIQCTIPRPFVPSQCVKKN